MKASDLRRALECGNSRCACHKANATLTHCPAHDDSAPSLSVTDGDSAVLFKCFKGCARDAIIEAVKTRGLWEVTEKVTPFRQSNEPVAVYRYLDAEGNLVGEKGRFEGFTDGKRSKSFLWRLSGESRWGGLNGLGMENMPLYNLPDVLRTPDVPVFVCEGEKAVQALVTRGALAVCLAGGASQTRFGNALDVLQDRQVILWPDNDDPGKALMARLAGMLPHAMFISPTVPEKGDAHDYFEQGGTLEALGDLLRASTPTARVIGPDAVEVTMPHPAGRVVFTFTEMTWTSRSTETVMEVSVFVTGVTQTPFRVRLNLMSSSGREGIRRDLEQVFGKSAIEWSRMLSTACSMADETWKTIDLSLDLAHVEVGPRAWFLDQRIPENAVTIVFGMGGSMKSLLVLDMGIHALMDAQWAGMALAPIDGLLVVDYEDQPEEWRLRAEGICRANGWEFPEGRFWYLPGNAIPIHEQRERIKKLVSDHNIGLVIVDSASSASGGELLDTPTISKIVNFLQTLEATVIMTAHNTKAEDSNYPYGSIQWHNLVRATHYVETKQEEGSKTAYSTVHNRKANRGKQPPVGVRVDFPVQDDGPIRITRDNTSVSLTASTSDVSLTTRIKEWLELHPGPRTTRDISEAMDISDDYARRELNRRRDIFVQVGNDRPTRWGLLSRSHAEVASF